MRQMILIIGLLMTLSSFAENERGNGGQTVYIGENAFLRDIVDKDNCIWHSSALVKKRYPEVNKVIDLISELHWMAGKRVNQEFDKLSFCFTERRLPPLSYNNSDDLYIFTNQLFDQPAINDNGIIFIDINLFNDMKPIHQAFLFIHEVAHEFFEKSEPREKREPRLRQFILNTYNHYLNPVDSETFKINLEMADFAYLKVDLNEINEQEINKILINKDLTIKEKSELFIKYRKHSEDINSNDSNRSKNLAPTDPLYLDGLKETLQRYRVEIREYLLIKLENVEIEEINNNIEANSIQYYFHTIKPAVFALLENIDFEDDKLQFKKFYSMYGLGYLNQVLENVFENGFLNEVISFEQEQVLLNIKTIYPVIKFKKVMIDVLTSLYTQRNIPVSFMEHSFTLLNVPRVAKKLNSEFLVKLLIQEKSFEFLKTYLSKEEQFRAIKINFNDILNTNDELLHEITIKYLIELGKIEELKEIVLKYLHIYLKSAAKLTLVSGIDNTLIDFSLITDFTPELNSDPELLLAASKFPSFKEIFEPNLDKFLEMFIVFDRDTHYTDRWLFEDQMIVDRYFLKDEEGLVIRFQNLVNTINESQKNELRKKIHYFFKSWSDPQYDGAARMFNQFKKQVSLIIYPIVK